MVTLANAAGSFDLGKENSLVVRNGNGDGDDSMQPETEKAIPVAMPLPLSLCFKMAKALLWDSETGTQRYEWYPKR
nr:hypothetical protein Iba_chr01bCG0960 [Ipomoea batatas]